MDAYPFEFLVHLQPTLIVTGLLPSKDNVVLSEKDGAHATATSTTSTAATNVGTPPPTPPRPPQPLSELEEQKQILLQALLSRNNVTAWDNTKGLAGSLYYIVPHERSYILPPTRKQLQATFQHHQYPTLSPSSPSSPLYPDGLITPLWIKRHREVLSSVFIAFVDLWDRKSATLSRQTGRSTPGQQPQVNYMEKGPLGVIDPLEREHDAQLAQELLDRRKACQERNVKFAAVLMLQRAHMEDPSIEDRLNFIRKSAGLDSKNSFYVLSPSSSQDLADFAVNLQRSQYEGSMTYYREQVKRHRKKKSGLPSTSSSVRPLQGMNGQGVVSSNQQSLSVQGWMLRYEFKMGAFSEFRQDIENAVKHYEMAYALLVDMFAVTSSITPGAPGLQARTRRWAEAKVLADCLCLKICKFRLYLDTPSTALFQFRRHLNAFKTFSDNWRIGEDSFEYWAWMCKQYRAMGDLLDIGTKAGFKLPTPTPGSVVYGSLAGMSEGYNDLNKFSGLGFGAGGFGIGAGGELFSFSGSIGSGRGGGTHGPNAGVNPLMVLQHTGYFYHQAAKCSVQRRLRFEIAEELYPDSNLAPQPTAANPFPPTLQTMNAERAIDHYGLTIELLTKSYEQFKKHKAARMTLFLASEIAGCYYNAGKFEMALKFFERIGKTYRREGWTLILASILKWAIQCAKEQGLWENVVEYLIELLSAEMPLTPAKREAIQDELTSILYTQHHPANNLPHPQLSLQMDHLNSFVTCNVQFRSKTAFISSPCPFQVHLNTQNGEGVLTKPFRLSYVRVVFSDPSLSYLFKDERPFPPAEGAEDKDDVHTERIILVDRTNRTIEWNNCHASSFEMEERLSELLGGDQPVLQGDDEQPQHQSVKGFWKAGANLDIRRNHTKVLEGLITPQSTQVLEVMSVTLGIITDSWNVSLHYSMPSSSNSAEATQQSQQQELQHAALQFMPPPPKQRRRWLDVVDDPTTASTGPRLRLRHLDSGNSGDGAVSAPLRVQPRESNVEIKAVHRTPAFLDEFFPIKIKVCNHEQVAVKMQMVLEVQVLDTTIDSFDSIVLDPAAALASMKTGQFTFSRRLDQVALVPVKGGMDEEGTSSGSDGDTEAPEIPVGAWGERTVYIRAVAIPTPRNVVCRVSYEVPAGHHSQSMVRAEKEHSFRVVFVPPFDAEALYYSQCESKVTAKKDAPGAGVDTDSAVDLLPPILAPNCVDPVHGTILIPALTRDERYLMTTRIHSEGPWPVQVQDVTLVLGSAIEAVLEGGSGTIGSSHGGHSAAVATPPTMSADGALHPDAAVATAALASDPASGGGGALARNQSVRRARERKKSLHDAGVHVEILETTKSEEIARWSSGNSQQDAEGATTLKTTVWRSGNLATFNHLIRVTMADRDLVPDELEVGYLKVVWRRDETDAARLSPWSESIVPLQPLVIHKEELFMTTDLPKYAQVNRPFTAKYTLHNPTNRLQELTMTIEPSEGMVYAGTMQTAFKVLPFGTHPIQMTCYPSSAGLVRLPRIKLVVKKRPVQAARRRGGQVNQVEQQEQHLQQQYQQVVRILGAVKMGDAAQNRIGDGGLAAGQHRTSSSLSSLSSAGTAAAGTAAGTAAAAAGRASFEDEAVVIFVKPESGHVVY
ncbi:hypothetical protein DFQ26_004195 [Actinomortierella ambigua]|nr:hypothetical protein DFQ26_004195 [Actinomortierella ambigua]